ncbi:putative disease resistance RPP13-like protein 1 [Beta vulgaris subsp. vulgaris]|uniref:putative disease resistance RPP13-like protein 1 n=1 Tax=Beta vulgaris subsp. vulgaris TaxID=3555 RepID=UPI0025465CB0|nr:putative disease resistance RPP13-like protein 1 [Beta vulgaris subsp. vulgaris]
MAIGPEFGFVIGLFNFLLTRIGNDVFRRIHELRKYKRKLDALEMTISTAQGNFKDVDPFLLKGRVKIVAQDRLDTFTKLCYEAEDLMDDIMNIMCKPGWCEKHNFVIKFIFGKKFWKIRKLQEKLDEIIAQLKMLTDESEKKDKGKQPDWGGGAAQQVGMHGVGKTALALDILDDPRIIDKFETSIVDVEDGIFDCKRSINELLNCKKKALENKKTMLLIMFDRLLNIPNFDWDDFLSKRREMENITIKILVTTLSPGVSETLGTVTYTLKPLLKEDCQKVIVQKGKDYDKERLRFLERNAKIMANYCEGLPGAARFLGIILGKCKIAEWTPVNLWDLQEFRNDIYPILSLEYSDKQHHLSRCLAYFALFPEEYDYNVDDLVQLWAAEGFVEQVQAGKILFNDIVQRSILQPSDEQNSIYKLHKFNHYLSKLATSSIFLLLPPGSSTSLLIESVRHLSLLCDIDEPLLEKLAKCKRLRTLLSLSNRKTDLNVKIPPNLFKKLKYLRVLALNRINIDNIPDAIYNLEHLRLLDISYTLIETLPDELCELHNLQFLKIKDTKLRQLPKDFKKLTDLRYVDWEIADIRKMNMQPGNIGTLSHLETLPLFRVSKEPEFAIKQLGNMNSLQGSISITGLENVESEEKSKEAKLCGKDKLKRIELEWTKRSSVCEQVLNGQNLMIT